jgi:phosphoribosylaminoimidazole-succinocarboxamide synthase
MLDKKKLGEVWPINTKPVILHDRKHLKDEYSDYYYPGKNGDVYFKQENGIIVIDLERSNRCSVFDIPLDLEIEGKGKIQTAISDLGFDFAEKFGIRTSRTEKAIIDIQFHELCKPLETEINGEIVQFEFIFRNYLTGSLRKQYDENEDLYGLNLPKGMNEWCKMPEGKKFTPTTKGVKDIPLNSDAVREKLPEIVSKLEELFEAFTGHCEERGVVMVDSKLEVFINSKEDWVLGDEVFTPESSRFILKENFDKGIYKSMDKQVLRDWGTKMGWKEQYKICIEDGYLKQGDKLPVFVPQQIQDDVIAGYQKVYDMLK